MAQVRMTGFDFARQTDVGLAQPDEDFQTETLPELLHSPKKLSTFHPGVPYLERKWQMILFYGLIIFVAVLVFWVIGKYNSLVTLRNQVQNGWKQIDVQLKRRHDLIPNLVNTVKGYMEFEQDTLDKVIKARNAAATATGISNIAAKESELSGVLSRLFSLTENYPTLKANENVKQLQEELSSTENKVSFARQFYNDIATKFNIGQQVFPGNIVAGVFGFSPAELFEVTSASEREVPAVDLSLRK